MMDYMKVWFGLENVPEEYKVLLGDLSLARRVALVPEHLKGFGDAALFGNLEFDASGTPKVYFTEFGYFYVGCDLKC